MQHFAGGVILGFMVSLSSVHHGLSHSITNFVKQSNALYKQHSELPLDVFLTFLDFLFRSIDGMFYHDHYTINGKHIRRIKCDDSRYHTVCYFA